MKTLTVLLVEDSADYASLVREWLSAAAHQDEFVLHWTDSLASASARLQKGGVDIILLDLGLPDSEGMDTWLSMREDASGLPVIILSSIEDQALALQAIQLGAQDYLSKSTCTRELLVRVLQHSAARYRSSQGEVRPEGPKGRPVLIALAGGSGGVGTTSVATVLAAEIHAQSGAPTLLMDLDLNPGLVAFTAGVDPRYSIQDALEWSTRLDSSVWDGLVTRTPAGLNILPSSASVAGSTAVAECPDPAMLRNVLDYARGCYRWILLDLGRLNHFSTQVLGWTDEVILITTPGIQALQQCKSAIAAFDHMGLDRERIQLIVNRRDGRYPVSREDIQNLFGIRIAANLPPSFEALHQACLDKRLPKPADEFRQGVAAVARKFAGIPDVPAKRSLFPLQTIKDRFLRRGPDKKESFVS